MTKSVDNREVTMDKLARVEQELSVLRENQKRLLENITQLSELWTVLKTEINQDNLKSVEWLIQNPLEPGVHEATKEWFSRDYGGEYNGIQSWGYQIDEDRLPLQMSFRFELETYSAKDIEERRQLILKNIKHFVENYIDFLSPVADIDDINGISQIRVVPFNFQSDTHHLDMMGYEPMNKEWYWYTLGFGITRTMKKFATIEEAFDMMFSLVNRANKYDCDY